VEQSLENIRHQLAQLKASAASSSRSGAKTVERDLLSAVDALQNMIALYDRDMHAAHTWPHVRDYNTWIAGVFGHPQPAPTYFMHSSWSFDNKWGAEHLTHLGQLISKVERDLFTSEVHGKGVQGAIVEFGIFHGHMLGQLLDACDQLGDKRDVFGFDSFEGLSEPSQKDDYDSWKKGDYAAGFDEVAAFLKLASRPNLTLVKGWVEDTLIKSPATAIDKIAYARIDVDIYPPTVDCLNYLSHRLVDGAILVFDDWCFATEKGETKAFYEWVPSVPHLRFEFLGSCTSRFYMRVHKR
jgi:Macrocin-O-methyltransferase (TylF)